MFHLALAERAKHDADGAHLQAYLQAQTLTSIYVHIIHIAIYVCVCVCMPPFRKVLHYSFMGCLWRNFIT